MEDRPSSPQEPIPYDLGFYMLDPENNAADKELVELSCGDLRLLLDEVELIQEDRTFLNGGVTAAEYYIHRDTIRDRIQNRRKELGLEDRPGL